MKQSNILRIVIIVSAVTALVSGGCTRRPSKVEIMRMEKARKDSADYEQAKRTVAYSDSLLQVLLPEVDSLMTLFKYEKNETYEDNGHYVHRLLATMSNTSRCFLQAYVSDDNKVTVQSYYYGAATIQQNRIRLSANDVYCETEGMNHTFDADGWHEIMTIEGDDALKILQFIDGNSGERIKVTQSGKSNAVFYLGANEKQALTDTYRLGVLTNDIKQLERGMRIAGLQMEKYEKRKESH